MYRYVTDSDRFNGKEAPNHLHLVDTEEWIIRNHFIYLQGKQPMPPLQSNVWEIGGYRERELPDRH